MSKTTLCALLLVCVSLLSSCVELPSNGASGKYGVFRVTEYLPDTDGKHRAFQGDTLVLLVEFGDRVCAQSLLSYGNASDPASSMTAIRHDSTRRSVCAQFGAREEIEANLKMRGALAE
jgi:acyl-homoserine-lactone acylase